MFERHEVADGRDRGRNWAKNGRLAKSLGRTKYLYLENEMREGLATSCV
jgi:hypothetical protein